MKQALHKFYRVLKPKGVLCVGLKEGEGSEEIVEKFTSDGARFYNYKTLSETEALVRDAGFTVKKSYIINERKRFGPDKRDLNWIYCFGVK